VKRLGLRPCCFAALAGAGLAVSISACSGGIGSSAAQPPGGTVAPLAAAIPARAALPTGISQTVRLGLEQTLTFGEIASGASGSVTFPATATGAGDATVTLQGTLPAGVPTPKLSPLAYLVVDASSALSFRATPAFTFSFPAGTPAGYAYLALFDPSNRGLGWTTIAGPSQTNGSAYTLPSQSDASPALSFAPKQRYTFALSENASVLPTPSPAPYTTIEYYVPGAFSYIVPITAGADGNVWFFQQDGTAGDYIDKITPGGIITRKRLKTPPYRAPEGIALGPDRNIWFTETANSSVARVTPDGDVSEYRLPRHGTAPWGITGGPDGNVWFTQPDFAIDHGAGYGAFGKVTPTGIVTDYQYKIPAGSAPGSFDPVPLTIATGADGNLWYAEVVTGAIGKMTTSGVRTDYPLAPGASPMGITAGPGGNIWFVEAGLGSIAEITPSGVITSFRVPGSSSLGNITTGPDGNLWVTDYSEVWRVTPSGAVTGFPTPTQPSGVGGITAGPDGNIWFAEYGVSQIGKIILPAHSPATSPE
jgi:streptogramin lyase